jgi:small toxic polypeptide LdrA/B/C/D
MMTYLLLDIIFILIICFVLQVKFQKPSRRTLLILCALLFLTLVFDSVLIYFHIIEYALDRISGLRVGLAPIEDYAYPILAVVIIPVLWKRFGKKDD